MMHYLRAYRLLFAQPGGFMIGLAISVCQLVPLLGQIVFTGYAFEVMEKGRDNNDSRLPGFDMERLDVYLTRGTWPFAVQLALMGPALLLCLFAGFILIALVSPGDGRSAATAPKVVLAALFPASFLLFLLLSVLLVPLTLYVGYRQHLDLPTARSFVRDFLKRVGRETVLAQLFVTVTGAALTLLGTALLCLPAAPALAVAYLAQYHLIGQLYRLYQRRGGAPVALPG